MIIKFTKSFDKQYAKLTPPNQKKFDTRFVLFTSNPRNLILRNHALRGKYLGYMSINISGDLRAIYKIETNRVIIFAFIGTHSQLY